MSKNSFLFLIVFTFAKEFVSSVSDICAPDEFPCYNGQCIERLDWCDTDLDCKDGTDESYCKKGNTIGEDPNGCRRNSFFYICLDGTCIPRKGRCDGYKDCPDNSDEKSCFNSSHVESEEFAEFPEIPDFPDISEALEVERAVNRPLRLHRYIDESTSYEDLPFEYYSSHLSHARSWLKTQQKEDHGWGDYTARAVISMYMSKNETFPKTKEELLMDKQLDIELSIALTRNETNAISLSELALNINALLAACKNPRNFYGYDLINILRLRTDNFYSEKKFVSPLVHLTLCLSNVTDYGDVSSLQETFHLESNVANKIDLLSLGVLASSCIIRTPLYSHAQYRRNIVKMLLNKLNKSGLPGNIYEASLAMQALNEAKVDPHEWNRDEAIEFILKSQSENGSFGDILATYYTIPILSGRSILSLSDHCGKDFSTGKTPLAILKNARRRKITVNYSLLFGDPVEMTQKVQLQIPEGTNFLDVMRLAEEENPNFRFRLDETKSDPFVYSIGGIPNDAECGRYWTLHIQNALDPNDFIPYGKDIRNLVPLNGDDFQYWWKQM